MKILNFGSLNIDYVYSVDEIVRVGETISVNSLNSFPGGKGLNQSVALSKAGMKVYHAGIVGKDGDILLDTLNKEEIDTKYVKKDCVINNGNAIIQVNNRGENCIMVYGGTNLSVTCDYIDEVINDFEKGDCLIIQNEISNIPYLVDRAYEKGMTIFFNPSPINEKIYDIDLQKINYFILNEIEVCFFVSRNDDINLVRNEFIKKFYNSKIILTLGEKGAYYFDNQKVNYQKAYKVDVVDTTAAGDTFTGYVIAGILKNNKMEDAMDRAAKAAAIAVSRKGASVSIPFEEEVLNYKFTD